MSYEAKLIEGHWRAIRQRDILNAARIFDKYRGFSIIRLDSNPPKFYAERGNIKTVLRNSIEETYRDVSALAVS
jgi:hypothetical protein